MLTTRGPERLATSSAEPIADGMTERASAGCGTVWSRPTSAEVPRPPAFSGRIAENLPIVVAFLDAILVTMLGLLVEPVENEPREIVGLLASGPLVALGLAASGGYRPTTIRNLRQSALALLVLLTAVILPVMVLGRGSEPTEEVPERVAHWLGTAFLALFGLRLALRRSGTGLVGSERPGLLLLSQGEWEVLAVAVRSYGRTLPYGSVWVPAMAVGLADLARRLERERLADILVSDRLLAAFGEQPVLGARLVDLLLAIPGRVRILLPGGSRERFVCAILHEPALGLGARFAKRALDIVGACLLLVMTAPVFLAVALAVKLDSPGPVFFRQPRLGYGGRLFRIWKFRTMREEASDPDGRLLTVRNDPRVTRVGAFLRRTSLDELPQLVNVLTGEMSLVGPRPHPIAASAGGRPYAEVVPDIARRLRVKPGMTGLAQVEGWRGNTNTERKLIERVEADLRYIATWSFWLDLEIVLRTPLASLFAKDAY